MKTLKRKIIENNLIPCSAGFKTDTHIDNSMSINTNPLPKKACALRHTPTKKVVGYEKSRSFTRPVKVLASQQAEAKKIIAQKLFSPCQRNRASPMQRFPPLLFCH